MVKKEKPADEGGLEQKATTSNVDKNQENVKELPVWAVRKIAMLAQERMRYHPEERLRQAVYSLEAEAIGGIRAELLTFPNLAEKVPADFARLLRTGSTTALTDYERGVMVLVDSDAKKVLPAINLATDLEEFLQLKWQSLGAILAGGSYGD
jgi:hypothetical protein